MKNARCSKLTQFAATALACMSAIVFAGCAGSPIAHQYMTTALVLQAPKDALPPMLAIQPILCELTTARTVEPQVFVDAVSPFIRDNRDSLALFNLAMSLYIGSQGDLAPTNTAKALPYAEAIFCAGMSNGLFQASQPATRTRNAPPATAKWPLVR